MKIRTIILLGACLAAASCAKEPGQVVLPGDTVGVQLNVCLPASGQQQTRSAMGEYLPDSRLTRFGLCVVPDGPGSETPDNYTWYHDKAGYDNILVQNTAPTSYNTTTGQYNYKSWSYLPRGGSAATAQKFGLFTSRGPVTIYGVHPYMADFHEQISDMGHIPFEIGATNATNHDYMYIAPVQIDPGVTSGATISRDIHLEHVMTALEIRLTNTHHGTVIVSHIDFEAFDNDGINGDVPAYLFSMDGTFSVIDGSVTPTPGSEVDKITMSYGTSVGYKYATYDYSRYTPYSLIVPPVEYRSGRKVKASVWLRYDGSDESDLVGLGGVLWFDLDVIKAKNGGHEGLLGGYRYVFTAEVDNFIKYSGYPEVEEWVVPDENDPDDGQIKDIIF